MPRYSPRTGLLQTYQVGPYNAAHLYLQWGGKLPGNETWSCGIRLRKITGEVVNSGEASALLAPVTAVVQAFHQREATGIAQPALLNSVKLNAIATDGTYMDAGQTFESMPNNIPGGMPGGAAAPPNQIALVVTTTTGSSRGPAHAGRFYLPLPAMTVGTDGLVQESVITAVDGSAMQFITALNAAAGGFEAAVFSRKAGAPANKKITGTKVGRVLDTQRRRRTSLTELYTP